MPDGRAVFPSEQIYVTLSLARNLSRQKTSAIRGAIKLTTPSLFVERRGVDEATAAITATAEQTDRQTDEDKKYRSVSQNLPSQMTSNCSCSQREVRAIRAQTFVKEVTRYSYLAVMANS